MDRVVISIEPLVRGDDDIEVYFRINEPEDVVQADSSRLLPCAPHQQPFVDLTAIATTDRNPLQNNLVKTVGQEVLNGLSAHPGVREAIDRAVNSQETTETTPCPLYIKTSATEAEALPWELLYHPDGNFLSLDPRWPMARMVGGRSNSIERSADLPIRIAVVLGASDRDATPEWEAIREAVQNSAVNCNILLLAAQPQLKQAVIDQADQNVVVEHIPQTEQELVDRLLQEKPHIVHFFCHGSASYEGFLEIATTNLLEGLSDEPVYLSARELSRLRETVWLVILDACEGATPTKALHSYTYSLVKDGIPSAIGMREPIEANDSSVFCGAFYKAAMNYLSDKLQNNGTRVELSWEFTLRSARAALCAMFDGPTALKAAQHKPWTLPVLYRRPGEFRLLPKTTATDGNTADDSRLLGELETYRHMRGSLPPSTPQSVLDRLDAMIQQVEASLYTDGDSVGPD